MLENGNGTACCLYLLLSELIDFLYLQIEGKRELSIGDDVDIRAFWDMREIASDSSGANVLEIVLVRQTLDLAEFEQVEGFAACCFDSGFGAGREAMSGYVDGLFQAAVFFRYACEGFVLFCFADNSILVEGIGIDYAGIVFGSVVLDLVEVKGCKLTWVKRFVTAVGVFEAAFRQTHLDRRLAAFVFAFFFVACARLVSFMSASRSAAFTGALTACDAFDGFGGAYCGAEIMELHYMMAIFSSDGKKEGISRLFRRIRRGERLCGAYREFAVCLAAQQTYPRG